MKYPNEQRTVLNWILAIMVIAAPSIGRAFYNPEQGRWLSRDPIEEQGGICLYSFAGSDPLNRIDSLGQFAFPTFSIPIYFDCPSLSGGCYKCVGKFSTKLPLPRNPQAFQTCIATMIGRMLGACVTGNYQAYRTNCDKVYACFVAFWGR